MSSGDEVVSASGRNVNEAMPSAASSRYLSRYHSHDVSRYEWSPTESVPPSRLLEDSLRNGRISRSLVEVASRLEVAKTAYRSSMRQGTWLIILRSASRSNDVELPQQIPMVACRVSFSRAAAYCLC